MPQARAVDRLRGQPRRSGGIRGPAERAQCQMPPLQVPLTRRWRLDTLYWATKPQWTDGMLPLVEPGLRRAKVGGVVGAGNRKVLAVFRCLHGGHEARTDGGGAEHPRKRNNGGTCAGVAAFAAEAVKLAQAEGYRSLKATEAGPLPAGMSDPFTLCIRLGKDSNLKRTSGNRRYPSSA